MEKKTGKPSGKYDTIDNGFPSELKGHTIDNGFPSELKGHYNFQLRSESRNLKFLLVIFFVNKKNQSATV